MNNNWQFDREFITKNISDIQKLLNTPNISPRIKRALKGNMYVLKNLNDKNYNYSKNERITISSNLEKLKRIALSKMKIMYKTLGPDLIEWLLDLTVLGTFDLDTKLEGQKTILDLETQSDLTIQNYNMKSRKYFEIAKEIILNRKKAQIELIYDEEIGSHCIYNDFTKQSFIVVNPNDAPWILNHEIQHAVEEICAYQTPDMYGELGPHYFEVLFLDTLYNEQGYLLTGDYIKKMKDTQDLLDYLYGYLNCLLIFSQNNFDISFDYFMETIIDYYDVDEETAYAILKEELITSLPINNINYLLSYLKAIELRERTFLTKKSSDSILEPYINSKRFKFYTPNDIDIYERFIQEMKSKTKILHK